MINYFFEVSFMARQVQSVNASPGLRSWIAAGVSPLLLTIASCNSGPSRIDQPGISVSGASSDAMEMYDSNGDGVVAGEELQKAPGLKSVLGRWDTNGDKGISADEISARIEAWQKMQTGLMSFGFKSTLDGRPLEGATVTFEPEAFLGDETRPAVSTTDMFGTGGPSIPKDQRPDPTMPPGVYIGLYKVKISKVAGGKETIPTKYNDETILGQEIAPDVPEIANNKVIFALSTN